MAGTAPLSRCSGAIVTALALVAALLVAMPRPCSASARASDGRDHLVASLHAPRVVHQGVVNQERGLTGHQPPLPSRSLALRVTDGGSRQSAQDAAAPHGSPLAGGYDATGPPEVLLT